MKIIYCSGVEGNSLYINDYRICGPKPWGGGKIIKEWNITAITDLLRIRNEIDKELIKEV